MSRLLGPSEGTRLVVGVDGNYFTTRRNTTVVMYTDDTLTVLADVRQDDDGVVGAAYAGSAVPTDSLSALVNFWFPDGVDTVWYADAAGNPRPVYASDDARLDALEAAETGTAAGLANHLADTVDAHDASTVSFSPTGSIAATDVQAALAEVATEYAAADTALVPKGTIAINVADYGAVGDGITDDTAALQVAIDARATAGGGDVMLPWGTTGTYIISPQATGSNKGLRLKTGVRLVSFYGVRLKLKDASSVSASQNPVVWADTASRIGLSNVTIDGNRAGQAGGQRTSCLELINCTDVDIDRCTFRNALSILPTFSGGYGIVAWNGSNDRVRVANCHFESNGQSDLALFWGTDWTVTNCTSKDTGYVPINVETSVGATIKRVTVTGWDIDTCDMAAITVIQNGTPQSAGVTVCEDVTIANVNAKNVHNNAPTATSIGGVRVRGTKRTTLRSIKINGCKGTGLYVTVDSNYTVDELVVDDFQLVGLADVSGVAVKPGVWLSGTATYPINNPTLTGLRIPSARSYGVQASYAPDLTLDDARVTDSANSGLNLDNIDGGFVRAKVRRAGAGVAGSFYGIVVNNSVGFEVEGCQVTDGMSQGIRVGGACTNFAVRNCVSYDTRAAGSKTQTYGVFITTTTTAAAFLVVGNVVKGNLTGGVTHSTADVTNLVVANNTPN